MLFILWSLLEVQLVMGNNQTTIKVYASLPLKQEQDIHRINNIGYVYAYSFTNLGDRFTNQTYCHVKPQSFKLELLAHKLIAHNNKSTFEDEFIDGKYTGEHVNIIDFIQVENDVVVLTDNGWLHYLEINEGSSNVRTLNQYKLTGIQLPITSSYLVYQNQSILIIVGNTKMQIQIKDTQFMNTKLITRDIQSSSIQQLLQFQNIILIRTQNQTTMYSVDLQAIFKYKDQYKYVYVVNNTIIGLTMNNQLEISLVNLDNNSVIMESIQIINSSIIDDFDWFATYSNAYLLVKQSLYEGQQRTIIIDCMLLEDGNLVEINRHYLGYAVQQITFTNQYALLIGQNMHQIYHYNVIKSIEIKVNYRHQDIILLPNIQQSIMHNKFQNTMIGITKKSLFVAKMNETPFTVSCYCSNKQDAEQSPFHAYLTINTTMCFNVTQQCNLNYFYNVNFVYPIVTSEDTYVGGELILVFVILFITCLGVYLWQYYKFRNITRQIRSKYIEYEKSHATEQNESINDSNIPMKEKE